MDTLWIKNKYDWLIDLAITQEKHEEVPNTNSLLNGDLYIYSA